MNDCESIFAALSSYLDSELPPGDCEEIERHIQDCAPCVEFVNSLRKSIRLGKQYRLGEPEPAIPPELKHALERAYREALSREKRET
jgi:predicted anti-sigma-YlaC factor YlaD